LQAAAAASSDGLLKIEPLLLPEPPLVPELPPLALPPPLLPDGPMSPASSPRRLLFVLPHPPVDEKRTTNPTAHAATMNSRTRTISYLQQSRNADEG
jgi:hypothetical protein